MVEWSELFPCLTKIDWEKNSNPYWAAAVWWHYYRHQCSGHQQLWWHFDTLSPTDWNKADDFVISMSTLVWFGHWNVGWNHKYGRILFPESKCWWEPVLTSFEPCTDSQTRGTYWRETSSSCVGRCCVYLTIHWGYNAEQVHPRSRSGRSCRWIHSNHSCCRFYSVSPGLHLWKTKTIMNIQFKTKLTCTEQDCVGVMRCTKNLAIIIHIHV